MYRLLDDVAAYYAAASALSAAARARDTPPAANAACVRAALPPMPQVVPMPRVMPAKQAAPVQSQPPVQKRPQPGSDATTGAPSSDTANGPEKKKTKLVLPECYVCLRDDYAPVVLNTCGHGCCEDCADKIDVCPACRKKIESTSPNISLCQALGISIPVEKPFRFEMNSLYFVHRKTDHALGWARVTKLDRRATVLAVYSLEWGKGAPSYSCRRNSNACLSPPPPKPKNVVTTVTLPRNLRGEECIGEDDDYDFFFQSKDSTRFSLSCVSVGTEAVSYWTAVLTGFNQAAVSGWTTIRLGGIPVFL